MESRNIKVIDEHSIDRNANLICAIDVDGSDYVIYWIERDSENDNIFISKILKNIDGTSSMVNIDDASEKEKMSEVVKEIVKYSIDNGESKLSNPTVNLPSGRTVNVVSVLFNKEQNINVQKTYVTTVKKAVTKVSEEYYNIVFEEPKIVDSAPIFETVSNPVVEPVKEEIPTIEAPVAPVVPPVVEPIPAAPVEPPVTPVIEPQMGPWEMPSVPASEPAAPVSEVTPADSVLPTDTLSASTEPLVSENTAVPPIFDLEPNVEPIAPAVPPVVEPVKEITPEPIVPPVVPTEPVAPAPVEVAPTPSASSASPLVFDATGESNLNKALGEVSSESAIPVEQIQPVREFGVDEPVVSEQPVQTAQPTDAAVQTPSMPTKAGFANNKFFMVIAIAFFMASCVFLGYEVFNYFQVIK